MSSQWDYFVEVNKRLPTHVEFSNMDHNFLHEDCEHLEKYRETGYGLAGGGIGPYEYCKKCDRILCKSQDTTG